ncbi:MAG TPA: MFS transporter [Terriglobales bacterium]|nr:MFS transporter [Terriglobales bacterium]
MSSGSTAEAALEPKSFLSPTAVAHAAFVPTGIVTVLLGPVLPLLSARWSMSDAQAGQFFTVQFLASVAGNLLSGIMARRFGYRLVLVLGMVCMALGVGALPLSAYHWMGVSAVGCYGVGLGLVIPACNLLVAEVNPEKRAAAVSLLNFSWSIGSVACPFLLVLFHRAGHVAWFFYSLAVFTALVTVLMASMELPGSASKGEVDSTWQVMADLLRAPAAIALAALFFVYVGVENSVGGWLASYAKRIADNAGAMWEIAPSFFYVGLLAGRGLAPLVLRRISETKMVRACVAMALLGVVALLGSGSLTAIFVSAGVIGLGLAAVYPITISLLSNTFGENATRLGSVMFMLGSLGAAVMPKMVGVASTATSSLRIGLILPLAGCVVLLVLYFRDWSKPAAA